MTQQEHGLAPHAAIDQRNVSPAPPRRRRSTSPAHAAYLYRSLRHPGVVASRPSHPGREHRRGVSARSARARSQRRSNTCRSPRRAIAVVWWRQCLRIVGQDWGSMNNQIERPTAGSRPRWTAFKTTFSARPKRSATGYGLRKPAPIRSAATKRTRSIWVALAAVINLAARSALMRVGAYDWTPSTPASIAARTVRREVSAAAAMALIGHPASSAASRARISLTSRNRKIGEIV
jgi:hypothetical protein